MRIDLIPVGDNPPESLNVIIEVPVGKSSDRSLVRDCPRSADADPVIGDCCTIG